jgi:hypothetical protein
MSEQLIHKDGKEQVVREDVAKKHRGFRWAFLSIAAFILIMLVLFLGGVIRLGVEPEPGAQPSPTPADTNRAVP